MTDWKNDLMSLESKLREEFKDDLRRQRLDFERQFKKEREDHAEELKMLWSSIEKQQEAVALLAGAQADMDMTRALKKVAKEAQDGIKALQRDVEGLWTGVRTIPEKAAKDAQELLKNFTKKLEDDRDSRHEDLSDVWTSMGKIQDGLQTLAKAQSDMKLPKDLKEEIDASRVIIDTVKREVLTLKKNLKLDADLPHRPAAGEERKLEKDMKQFAEDERDTREKELAHVWNSLEKQMDAIERLSNVMDINPSNTMAKVRKDLDNVSKTVVDNSNAVQDCVKTVKALAKTVASLSDK